MAQRAVGKTTRDLVLSIAPLVVIALFFAGFANMCSFSPAGPQTDQDAVRTVDVSAELARAAGEVAFAVRDPRVPADWRANSFSLRPVGEASTGARAVRVGWILPSGGYLRLSQSDSPELELVQFETEQSRPVPTGTVEVSGVSWVRYPSVRAETAWAADVDGVRLLVTGSATEPDLRTLASAVLAAQPLDG